MPANKLKPDTEDVYSKLATLREDYINKLPEKLLLINQIWQKLTYLSWNDDAFGSLYRLIHGLTGSGKTFGCEQLSIEAKTIEDFLSPLIEKSRQPTDKERLKIEALIGNLAQAAQLPMEKESDFLINLDLKVTQSPSQEKTIFIVDDESDIRLYLSTVFSNVGYKVRTFSDPKQACDFIDHCLPDLVLMDIVFPGNSTAGFEAVNEIRVSTGKKIPFIFMSARTDLASRASVVRAGGDAYFTKPLEINTLIDKVAALLERENTEHYKVLIVDDDIELSEFHSTMLKDANMNVCSLSQPINIMQKIDEFKPDLILMDMHMPQYSGIELANVIRQDDKLIGLPIVFLSSEQRESYHERAYNVGANDFLLKPVSKELLVNTVTKQIRYSRRIKDNISKASKFNPSLGLYNRQYFLEKLDAVIALTGTRRCHTYLLDINIDNILLVKEKFGIECLDSLNQQVSTRIRSQLPEGIIASQFSDAVYMVLANEIQESQLIDLVRSILGAIEKNSTRLNNQCLKLTSSIGIVEINENILSIHELLGHAESACIEAREKQGNNYYLKQFIAEKKLESVELVDRIKLSLKEKLFHLVYQPIVNVDNHNHEMYEALIRMGGENDKAVLPSQFIPLVEETESIVAIDKWVIDNAIASISNDSHARTSTDLFVKISGYSLKDRLIIPWISNAITEGGINGDSRVIFHIIETNLVKYSNEASVFRSNLKKLKCGMSIDHYGVTESSLRFFELLRPDYVKLRESILNQVTTDSSRQAFIEKLVTHALENDTKVIASTIEDPATLSMLWSMGVRHFQGYFIQKC